jgi:hypothetical protein
VFHEIQCEELNPLANFVQFTNAAKTCHFQTCQWCQWSAIHVLELPVVLVMDAVNIFLCKMINN